MAPPIKKL